MEMCKLIFNMRLHCVTPTIDAKAIFFFANRFNKSRYVFHVFISKIRKNVDQSMHLFCQPDTIKAHFGLCMYIENTNAKVFASLSSALA